MDEVNTWISAPSPPSSVPAVLAVKGIAPVTALAACGGAWVLVRSGVGMPPAGLSYPLDEDRGRKTCIAPDDR